MARRKVIDIPEAQFVGALERQVDQLAERVDEAVRRGDRQRAPGALVEEAQQLLRAGTRALGRRRPTGRRKPVASRKPR